VNAVGEVVSWPFRQIWRIWQEIHAASVQERRDALDWRPLVVLFVVALSLTFQEFVGDRDFFRTVIYPLPRPWKQVESNWELWSFAYWTGWRFFGYLLLPMIVVLCMPGERLRDYHLSIRGFVRHWWIYVLFYLTLLPGLILLAQTRQYQKIYPFYRLANRSTFDLVAWEVMYAIQFVSLEFFFRGFILQALRRSMGMHAVWVMIVPYCMIHYGKTLSETLASIFAGLILGTVAMRTKSIWGGAVLHVAVALTMDLLCLPHCPRGGVCK
jgi:membrane protease YdiL (CAAX protease family)